MVFLGVFLVPPPKYKYKKGVSLAMSQNGYYLQGKYVYSRPSNIRCGYSYVKRTRQTLKDTIPENPKVQRFISGKYFTRSCSLILVILVSTTKKRRKIKD